MSEVELEEKIKGVVNELEKVSDSPEGGYLLIVGNGDGFERIAYRGDARLMYRGLKQMMFNKASFRSLVYQAVDSVRHELDEGDDEY